MRRRISSGPYNCYTIGMTRTIWYSLILGVCIIVAVFSLSSIYIYPSNVDTIASSTPPISSSTTPIKVDTVRYSDPLHGVTLTYPKSMTPDPAYVATAADTHTSISGFRLYVSTTAATGTNLSADSFVSIEYPTTATCTPSFFLDYTNNPTATIAINGMTYLAASSSDAGAGNRYDQIIYIPQAKSCIAVRYFIHYTAIENYTPGTIREFDRASLLKTFDAIRDSLTIK